jgi:alkanesulfonate monooxygenase SsuD/methylene tetrahydromethanopterin reductase-like flavin-dependent oxidoreductase (luciferase family)
MRDYLEIIRGLLRGEEVTYDGGALSISKVRIGRDFPFVPVFLAALGPQMLRLAGASADGASLNWATPAQIAHSRAEMRSGATAAGRDPDELKLSMYIRVCIDEDVPAARRAFATQVLGYAMVRPGGDTRLAYRGLFGRMGFEETLLDLEARRAAGEKTEDLLDDVPEELLTAVGYYGSPDGAAARFAELAVGLDEVLVRVITTTPDPGKVRLALETLTPTAIRAAS